MSHLIDIILLAVVLLVVFVSAKRGIIITLFDMVSAIIAAVFAKLIAPGAASFIYDSFLKEKALSFLSEKYSGIQGQISSAVTNSASLFDFLPKGMKEFALASGIFDRDAVSESIMHSITTVEELEAKVVSPVIHSLLNIICFSVLALVLVIVLRIVGRIISKLVKKSKIAEKLDIALGVVLGLIKGGIYSFVLAGIVCVVSYASETLAAYAADSYICSFVSNLIGL